MSDLVTVVVGMPHSGLTPYQWGALLLGLALGVFNLIWTTRLARQNRRRSVDDEFWFRKVIAPSVIDKTLEFSASWGAELSGARSLKPAVAKKKISQCKDEGALIVSGCLCLKLYSNESYINSSAIIDEMVDAVTECVYGVTSTAISDDDADQLIRSKKESIQMSLLKLLGNMKGLQKNF